MYIVEQGNVTVMEMRLMLVEPDWTDSEMPLGVSFDSTSWQIVWEKQQISPMKISWVSPIRLSEDILLCVSLWEGEAGWKMEKQCWPDFLHKCLHLEFWICPKFGLQKMLWREKEKLVAEDLQAKQNKEIS